MYSTGLVGEQAYSITFGTHFNIFEKGRPINIGDRSRSCTFRPNISEMMTDMAKHSHCHHKVISRLSIDEVNSSPNFQPNRQCL